MNAIEIITSILTVLNIGGLLGTIIFFRSSRRKAKSEADCAEAEANTKEWSLEESRIRNLHDMLDRNNETVSKYISQIEAEREAKEALYKKLDSARERTSEISDRLYQSEQEKDRLNAQLVAKTEECDRWRRQAEYYKRWKCHKGGCGERQPENPDLKNEVFVDPT